MEGSRVPPLSRVPPFFCRTRGREEPTRQPGGREEKKNRKERQGESADARKKGKRGETQQEGLKEYPDKHVDKRPPEVRPASCLLCLFFLGGELFGTPPP